MYYCCRDVTVHCKIKSKQFLDRGRRGGLMVSALNSGASGPGSSLCQDIVLCSWARHSTPPIQGGVILLVASCYRNQDKLRPDGPLNSHVDFTFPNFSIFSNIITLFRPEIEKWNVVTCSKSIFYSACSNLVLIPCILMTFNQMLKRYF